MLLEDHIKPNLIAKNVFHNLHILALCVRMAPDYQQFQLQMTDEMETKNPQDKG